jgi:hyperosmotically inducible protein
MKGQKLMIGTGLGLALAGLLAIAQPVQAEEGRTDAAILKDVRDAVAGYARYTVFDAVGVEVHDGTVMLQGSVLEPYRKTDLERRVAKVKGVHEVRNQIDVQPVSFSDDRLRSQLVRRIYGGGVLVNPSLADPPVRIVVNNGRITLLGYVNSEVERQMVGAIARGTLSFGVDNQLRLEREQAAEDRKAD